MARLVASLDVFVLSFCVVSVVMGCLISIFMVVPVLFTDRQLLPFSIFVSDFEKDLLLQVGVEKLLILKTKIPFKWFLCIISLNVFFRLRAHGEVGTLKSLIMV